MAEEMMTEKKTSDGGFRLPERVKTTLKMPVGMLTQAGQEDVVELMAKMKIPPVLPDFEWQWCTKSGTLPKRIQRHAFKVGGLKLTAAQMTQIGNVTRAHAPDTETYVFDFTKKFDWRAGDFGDSESCFWQSNTLSLGVLARNGGLAVRLFQPENPKCGYARAWMVQQAPRRLVLFNAYGATGLVMARALSQHFGTYYRWTDMSVDGSHESFWINRGGRAVIVGDYEDIKAVTNVDLTFDLEPECELCKNRTARQYANKKDILYCDECNP